MGNESCGGRFSAWRVPCARYHRIIDLHAFRDLVARGEMTSADFLTVGNSNGREHPASHMHVEEDVREFFKEYSAYKVSERLLTGLRGTTTLSLEAESD